MSWIDARITRGLGLAFAVGCAASPGTQEDLGTQPEPLPKACMARGQTERTTISRTCEPGVKACTHSFSVDEDPTTRTTSPRLLLSELTCDNHSTTHDGNVWSVELQPGESTTCTLDLRSSPLADVPRKIDAFLRETRTVSGEASQSMALADVSVVASPELCNETLLGGVGGAGGTAATGGNLEPCGKPPFIFFCTGNCSVCNHALGQCEPNPNVCYGNCSKCTGLGHEFSCRADPTECTGNCEKCEQSPSLPRDFNCVADPTRCTGNCDICTHDSWQQPFECRADETLCPGSCLACSGSGTQFSCGEAGCSPGTCTQCGTNKVKICNDSCTWGACVTGSCQ